MDYVGYHHNHQASTNATAATTTTSTTGRVSRSSPSCIVVAHGTMKLQLKRQQRQQPATMLRKSPGAEITPLRCPSWLRMLHNIQ